MSHSTNSNVNFCDALSFETKKGLYRHQSNDSKHKELLEKMFGSDDEAPIDIKPKAERVVPENMEKVYDSEEKYNFLRPKPQTESVPKTMSKPQTESIPKDNTKYFIKTKAITKSKTKTEDKIYRRIKYESKECHADFKNKIALTTHSYSHNRKHLENTEYFEINSSQNMK